MENTSEFEKVRMLLVTGSEVALSVRLGYLHSDLIGGFLNLTSFRVNVQEQCIDYAFLIHEATEILSMKPSLISRKPGLQGTNHSSQIEGVCS